MIKDYNVIKYHIVYLEKITVETGLGMSYMFDVIQRFALFLYMSQGSTYAVGQVIQDINCITESCQPLTRIIF